MWAAGGGGRRGDGGEKKSDMDNASLRWNCLLRGFRVPPRHGKHRRGGGGNAGNVADEEERGGGVEGGWGTGTGIASAEGARANEEKEGGERGGRAPRRSRTGPGGLFWRRSASELAPGACSGAGLRRNWPPGPVLAQVCARGFSPSPAPHSAPPSSPSPVRLPLRGPPREPRPRALQEVVPGTTSGAPYPLPRDSPFLPRRRRPRRFPLCPPCVFPFRQLSKKPL